MDETILCSIYFLGHGQIIWKKILALTLVRQSWPKQACLSIILEVVLMCPSLSFKRTYPNGVVSPGLSYLTTSRYERNTCSRSRGNVTCMESGRRCGILCITFTMEWIWCW
uniref:Uncharacterized protein n=2 Tax=Cacopsylla melanoneura TaxID=428564 RepID=A0A8D9AG91_9HEMI